MHKVFFDDESYDQGHGQAYKQLGIDSRTGCAVIIRPDQCKLQNMTPGSIILTPRLDVAKISTLDGVEAFEDFFAGFMLNSTRLKL